MKTHTPTHGVFGVLGSDGSHIDTSLTQRGAKCYATRHGYKSVTKRVGYNARVVAENINNKWVVIL